MDQILVLYLEYVLVQSNQQMSAIRSFTIRNLIRQVLAAHGLNPSYFPFSVDNAQESNIAYMQIPRLALEFHFPREINGMRFIVVASSRLFSTTDSVGPRGEAIPVPDHYGLDKTNVIPIIEDIAREFVRTFQGFDVVDSVTVGLSNKHTTFQYVDGSEMETSLLHEIVDGKNRFQDYGYDSGVVDREYEEDITRYGLRVAYPFTFRFIAQRIDHHCVTDIRYVAQDALIILSYYYAAKMTSKQRAIFRAELKGLYHLLTEDVHSPFYIYSPQIVSKTIFMNSNSEM